MGNDIIMDARMVLAYEALYKISDYAGHDTAWTSNLWSELVNTPILLKEFMYYVDNHCFSDNVICEGYSLTDLYVYQMSRYNLVRDIEKNTSSCNKDYLALGAFYDMACMLKNPEKYKNKLSDGPGMDQL